MNSRDNTITYIEFPASDRAQMQAAQVFYGAVFGWHYPNWGDNYAGTDRSGMGSGLFVSGAAVNALILHIHPARKSSAFPEAAVSTSAIRQETSLQCGRTRWRKQPKWHSSSCQAG